MVLILREFHDRLDAAVARAYGWPVDLADEEILSRLVALNKARAAEEARGQVRWLRPEYQIPRLSQPAGQAEMVEPELAWAHAKARKNSFPSEDIAQTAAVMSALAGATEPLDADAIAGSFRQGHRIESKIEAVLAALQRMGYVEKGDRGFALRQSR